MKLPILTTIFFSCAGTLLAMATMPVSFPERVTAQQQQEQPLEQPPVNSTRKRHTIAVTVSSPEDIKVEEGDRITQGAIIADRTRERQELIQRRKQLNLAIAKASEPTPTPPPPPEPSYAAQQVAVEEAREMVAYWKQVPKPEYRFKQEDLILSLDTETVEKRQTLAQKRIEAQQELNSAIANLQDAKSRYQRELYNYQIKLSQAKADGRQQAIDLLRMQEKLDNLNQEIEELSVIRSPYPGRVRRVKIISQTNSNITAEVTLLVKSSEN
jgi:multidrug resistance efflux pump